MDGLIEIQILRIHLSVIVSNDGFQHTIEFYKKQLFDVFGLSYNEESIKGSLKILFELSTQAELCKHRQELLIDLPDQFYEGK